MNGRTNFAIARYNVNGAPDTTFSDDGKVTTGFASQNGEVNSLAIQSDGKIIAAGTTYSYSHYHFTLVRYKGNSSLDTTFSHDGKQITDFGADYNVAHSLIVQSDGKIIAAGTTGAGASDFAVARYNTNGTLDKTFSQDGKQITDFGADADTETSAAIQSDGKILVAGTADLGTGGGKFALARYNKAGTLDKTFSDDGKLIGYFPAGNTTYTAVATQSDGKIVVAGYTYTASGADFVLARYNTDGTLDTTFSLDGKQTTDFGSTADLASSLAIQKDGRIVLAGSTNIDNSGADFALARYNPDGTLDTTFSQDGRQTTDFTSGNDFAASVALQGDGKIVLAGMVVNNYYRDFGLARYNTDGTLDITFSGDGKQTVNFSADDDYANALAIQADGKIVVAGTTYNIGLYDNSFDFAIARFNTDGSPDNTFNKDGKQTTDFNNNSDDRCSSIAIQIDGKIVATGNTHVNSEVFAVVRYNINGSLDSTFNNDGKQTSDFGPVGKGFIAEDYATSAAIQSNGKIIVAGETYRTDWNFALARYNTNGTLDTIFGQNGKQITEATEGEDFIKDITIYKNKLYIAGSGQNPGNVGVVARYLLDNERVNKPPTVTLSTPYNIVKYSAPARIKLQAAATDQDGKVTKVHFFSGSTTLHTENVYPYDFLWINVPVGNYTLTAKAYDSGNVATSNAINVLVVEENVPPVVSIENPVNDTTYTGPATIHLVAKAKDNNDRISKVEFYNGTSILRTEYIYPYTYNWINVQPGTYIITAKAYDDKGLSATSKAVIFTVTETAAAKRRPISSNNKNNFPALRLSPNPAKNSLNIYTSELEQNKPSTILVISATGVVMKTIHTKLSNQIVQLDVSALAKGVYTVKVATGKQVVYMQFVKL
ncbi:Ig-like domain-containing protein [Segetibacter koreensis]|uniref:Ig-like domain-containing protein n=1 Tax=Segetibacter koreensis TaxID=398037 RepID=UPI0012FC5D11|nr:Ig-like domain-containing protein [Segetibacter koreensis]